MNTLLFDLDIITARSSHVCSTDNEKDTQQAAQEARWGLQGIHIDNFPLSDIFILRWRTDKKNQTTFSYFRSRKKIYLYKEIKLIGLLPWSILELSFEQISFKLDLESIWIQWELIWAWVWEVQILDQVLTKCFCKSVRVCIFMCWRRLEEVINYLRSFWDHYRIK